jgi:hypothetical protein
LAQHFYFLGPTASFRQTAQFHIRAHERNSSVRCVEEKEKQLRNRFFLFGLTPDALDADAFAAASCVR